LTRDAKRSRRSFSRFALYMTPVVLAVILGVVIYASWYSGETYVVNTHTYLMVAIVDQKGNTRYVIPDKAIGIPGGYIATTQYLSDGVNGNYPLWTSPSLCGNVTGTGDLCLIRIVSKVQRSYTLGDFFKVWGVPLGPTETFSPSLATNSTFSWTMCTSNSGNPYVPKDDWGSHVLVSTEVVLLAYSPTTLGCA